MSRRRPAQTTPDPWREVGLLFARTHYLLDEQLKQMDAAAAHARASKAVRRYRWMSALACEPARRTHFTRKVCP